MRLNNSGGNLRQMLIDSAPFYSDLLYTAIPQRAAAGTTATFTRATAKRWKNNDGYEVVGLAGEMDFPGARRIRNHLRFTNDLTNAAWTKINGGTGTVPVVTAGQTDPNGGTTAFRVQANSGASATGADYSVVRQVLSSATVNLRWIYIKSNTGAPQTIYFGAPANNQSITATTEWQQLSAPLLGGNTAFDIGAYPGGGSGMGGATCDVLVWHPQAEDVTAQVTQIAREHVSSDVESAPYYHGSMVDGVKCFATDINGNPLTTMERHKPESAGTNYITQSNNLGAWTPLGSPSATKNAVGPNGQANYAWTLTDNDAAGYEGVQTVAAFAAGAAGCFSVLVAKKASSPSYPGIQFYHNTAGGATTAFIINEVAGTMVSFGTVAATAYGCVSYNEDFWLVWCSNKQAGGSLSAALELYAAVSADGSTPSAAGQGSTAFSDAQFEQGTTVPSSRIATAGAAASRNADVGVYSGGDVPDIKMLMVGFQRESGVTNQGVIASLDTGAGTTAYGLAYLDNAATLYFQGANTTLQWQQTATNPYVAGSESRVAFSVANNDIKMGKDGVTQTSDTAASAPSTTVLSVGHYAAGQLVFNGNVGPLVGWTRNGSQTEVNAVSTP